MLDILHLTSTRSNANSSSAAKQHPDSTRPEKPSASEPTSAKAQQTHYDRPQRSRPNNVVTVLDRAAKLALDCRDVVCSSLRTETAAFKKRRRELEALMNNVRRIAILLGGP